MAWISRIKTDRLLVGRGHCGVHRCARDGTEEARPLSALNFRPRHDRSRQAFRSAIFERKLSSMSEAEALFQVLRKSADAGAVNAIEQLVRDGRDRELCRVNTLAFAAKVGLGEEPVISAFLHAARIGLFDLSWNVPSPGCGGVLNAGAPPPKGRRAKYRRDA